MARRTFRQYLDAQHLRAAGLYISNTSTSGRIYELSSEHHVRANEIMLDHASNWSIYALQTEEESGEGAMALPIDVQNSSNIIFATITPIASSHLSAISVRSARY